MKDPRDIIIAPVVSEKSYALIEANVYTFVVDRRASKPEIHDAVEAIWGVEVLKVNTLNRKGKAQRTRRSNRQGRRADTKRAIVTVAAGDRILICSDGLSGVVPPEKLEAILAGSDDLQQACAALIAAANAAGGPDNVTVALLQVDVA